MHSCTTLAEKRELLLTLVQRVLMVDGTKFKRLGGQVVLY